jgi:hypothetical protein
MDVQRKMRLGAISLADGLLVYFRDLQNVLPPGKVCKTGQQRIEAVKNTTQDCGSDWTDVVTGGEMVKPLCRI